MKISELFKRLFRRHKKEETTQQPTPVYNNVITMPTQPTVVPPTPVPPIEELPFYNKDAEKYTEEIKGINANIPVGAIKAQKVYYVGNEGLIRQPTKLAHLFPQPLENETLLQYAIRTSPITGFPCFSAGGFLFSASTNPGKNFQEKVEYFMNPWPYYTEEQTKAQRAADQYFIDEKIKIDALGNPDHYYTKSDRLYDEGKIKTKS